MGFALGENAEEDTVETFLSPVVITHRLFSQESFHAMTRGSLRWQVRLCGNSCGFVLLSLQIQPSKFSTHDTVTVVMKLLLFYSILS